MAWERVNMIRFYVWKVYWKICCHNLTHTFSFSVIGNIVFLNKTIFKVFIHFVFFNLSKIIELFLLTLFVTRNERYVIFSLVCSFSYSALVMSHFTCLHLVLLIITGIKRCAHVKMPLASKYISGRHNVLKRSIGTCLQANLSTANKVFILYLQHKKLKRKPFLVTFLYM